ncbi:hypothetical protein BDP27DRAFT_299741 [Rhodocollybia butyracea]|uniref:Uncharacterized protein n=1 Tax=Rhodocollybia butyracea TaxID=206335 RepID=A0A9P5Q3G0_9AGAR|nr:hypothetical protein BDP27DRAFT_299741 [Rhodocollybia butyracea]
MSYLTPEQILKQAGPVHLVHHHGAHENFGVAPGQLHHPPRHSSRASHENAYTLSPSGSRETYHHHHPNSMGHRKMSIPMMNLGGNTYIPTSPSVHLSTFSTGNPYPTTSSHPHPLSDRRNSQDAVIPHSYYGAHGSTPASKKLFIVVS